MSKFKERTVWCIEAQDSNFLKEIITKGSGQRLLFTDRFDDTDLKFGSKENAEQFKKGFNLDWLTVTDHLIVG